MSLSTEVIKKNFENLIESNLSFEIKSKDFISEKLLPQELHIKIDGDKIQILRKHEFQDNLRINFFINFLIQSLSILNSKISFEAIFNLSEGIEEDFLIRRFCYSQMKGLNHILIPDAHNFVTWQKITSLDQVDIPFDKKSDSAIFVGSDTGKLKNNFTCRSLFCKKFYNHKNIIAKLSGGIRDEVIKQFQDMDITSNFLHIQDQLKHKIILNIDGNSTSWERPLWAMASNSICVYINPFHEYEFESWFYPMMNFLNVMPKVSINNFEFFMENNFEDCFWTEINEKQKIFAKFIGDIKNQVLYFSNLLYFYNKQYNE
jgi:hypothetical protein